MKSIGKSSFRSVPAALFSAVVLAAFLAFLAFPARYLQCVSDGVSLWAASVLPAVLPFLFLTGLLAETPLFARLSQALAPLFARLFKVSGAGGCAALLSLLSGYPAGAKTVQRLYAQGRIGKEERLRCACLASTSGPAFLVGVAGTAMTGSAALGWLLFFSHVTGILGVSFLLARNPRAQRPARAPVPAEIKGPSAAIPETLASSVLSVLTVGGAVAIFYAFGCMLTDLLAPPGLPSDAAATLAGLLEMTAGCSRLLSAPTPATLAAAAFLTTFGGLCVLIQQWSFLCETQIAFGRFILVKFAQGLLAAAVCFGLACAAGV